MALGSRYNLEGEKFANMSKVGGDGVEASDKPSLVLHIRIDQIASEAGSLGKGLVYAHA